MATSSEVLDAAAMVHSIHHVNFPISDVAATEEWYGKVFGMVRSGPPRDPNYVSPNPRGLFMQTPDGRFHLHFNAREGLKPVPESMHFAIEVEDWETFRAHLDRLGIEYGFRGVVEGRPEQSGRRPNDDSLTAHIRDPDGYAVEVTFHQGREW
jgi:lactoylglutathione lyase